LRARLTLLVEGDRRLVGRLALLLGRIDDPDRSVLLQAGVVDAGAGVRDRRVRESTRNCKGREARDRHAPAAQAESRFHVASPG
jgi:hypothetical protein